MWGAESCYPIQPYGWFARIGIAQPSEWGACSSQRLDRHGAVVKNAVSSFGGDGYLPMQHLAYEAVARFIQNVAVKVAGLVAMDDASIGVEGPSARDWLAIEENRPARICDFVLGEFAAFDGELHGSGGRLWTGDEPARLANGRNRAAINQQRQILVFALAPLQIAAAANRIDCQRPGIVPMVVLGRWRLAVSAAYRSIKRAQIAIADRDIHIPVRKHVVTR